MKDKETSFGQEPWPMCDSCLLDEDKNVKQMYRPSIDPLRTQAPTFATRKFSVLIAHIKHKKRHLSTIVRWRTSVGSAELDESKENHPEQAKYKIPTATITWHERRKTRSHDSDENHGTLEILLIDPIRLLITYHQ